MYWENHDQPRVVSRFGDDDPDYWAASAKALATILHGMRGTPFVYQGEELGMTNYPFRSAHDHQDLEAVNYYTSVLERGGDAIAALAGLAAMSRDNARTPMQWGPGRNAGFTTGDPWIPVNPNHTWLNAESQLAATDSVFAHYQALIRLRHELPILVHGDVTPLMADDPQIWAYTRRTPDGAILVIANCGRQPRTVDIGAEWIGAAPAARQPSRHPGRADIDVPAVGRLGCAHLRRRLISGSIASGSLSTTPFNRYGCSLIAVGTPSQSGMAQLLTLTCPSIRSRRTHRITAQSG